MVWPGYPDQSKPPWFASHKARGLIPVSRAITVVCLREGNKFINIQYNNGREKWLILIIGLS